MAKISDKTSVVVDHVYKDFIVYLDKAPSLKEKLLFS